MSVVAPKTNFAGYTVAFLSGVVLGYLFNGKGSLKGESKYGKHEFTICPKDDVCLEVLDRTYAENVDNLKKKSLIALNDFKNEKISKEKKENILEKTISHYLVPISEDKIAGRQIILFNGQNKPTILKKSDYREIEENWHEVLKIAGIDSCVDALRPVNTNNKFSCFDEGKKARVCEKCIPLFLDAYNKK